MFYVYTYDSDPYRAMELANAIGRVAPKEISRIVKSGGIEVIDYATLPEAPYSSTSLVKYALVGFAGCFGASFVLFLLAGLMDTTIRRRYELKLAFRIPVLEEAGLDYGTEALSGRIGTSVVENTAVFYVYTYDSDPYRAMELANAIGRVAPKEISRIVKSGGIEVIDYATLPEAPYSSTSLVKYALVGFAGCFGASFVLFLLAGLMDTTIRRRYELKLAFRIPVLGDIPQIQAPDRKSKPVLVLGENSSFAVKESYNTIRANLLFTGKGERCPVYAVTSADKDEGKTLNSVNIAISYAQLGKKVLLIDGDMRNMAVASLLKLRGRLGLSQYLAGLRETPQIVEYRQNLDVLVGGENPPNPSELLGGERMKELLTTLRSRYDCIIIDLPPVGIVTDALLLSHEVTAYLLVVRAGVSHMSREKSAVTLLEQVDADICGILFNGLPPKSKDCNYRLQQYWQEYKQQNGEAV